MAEVTFKKKSFPILRWNFHLRIISLHGSVAAQWRITKDNGGRKFETQWTKFFPLFQNRWAICNQSFDFWQITIYFKLFEGKISCVYFMIWWLFSIRNAWGHEVKSQQSCRLKGEIRITPAMTTELQLSHWNWDYWTRSMMKKNLLNKFWDLHILLQRCHDVANYQHCVVNHFTESSYGATSISQSCVHATQIAH